MPALATDTHKSLRAHDISEHEQDLLGDLGEGLEEEFGGEDEGVKDDQVYGGGSNAGGEDGCGGSFGFIGMILAATVTMIIFMWDIVGLCKMICSSLGVSHMPLHYKYKFLYAFTFVSGFNLSGSHSPCKLLQMVASYRHISSKLCCKRFDIR